MNSFYKIQREILCLNEPMIQCYLRANIQFKDIELKIYLKLV